MAPSHPDRRRRGLLLALAATAACGLAPAFAQRITTGGNIEVKGDGGALWDFEADTLSMKNVQLRQNDGTLITAGEAKAFGISDNFRNARWELSGAVHIEYRDTRLDADNAIITYAGGNLRTIQVRGTPARFAQVTEPASRRSEGRADQIDFNAGNREATLSGNGWFRHGDNEARTARLYYNLDTRVLRTDEGVKLDIVIPERRIVPPRTPDRSTAP